MLVNIEKAAECVLQGHPIAVPTDTVYGLAALYNNVEAVQKIYTLKGRSASAPLVILLADLEELPLYVQEIPPDAPLLMKQFWPGPLTLIFAANTDKIPSIVRSQGTTIGIRIPNHDTLRTLIRKTGPLVATSVNKTGEAEATTPYEIGEVLGHSFPLLSSDQEPQGVASTVVSFDNGMKILRHGLIANDLKKIKFLLHTSA